MNRTNQTLSLLISLSLLCASPCFTACAKKEAYADGIPCAELADAAEDQIPVDFGYETFGGEHLRIPKGKRERR